MLEQPLPESLVVILVLATREAASVEQELARLRSWMGKRQNMVEAILEEQTSTELEAEGFGLWGYVWPPVKIRFTPPAKARSHSPLRRLWQATCTATSEAEQAVSTARLGPCRSKK